jgi:YVTN family beta-propeller protein
MSVRPFFAVLASCLVSLGLAQSVGAELPDYTLFEAGQVRPLAMSPDGTRLFAVNTPNGRLEIYDIGSAGLEPLESVPVGLEPVALAARSDGEVWVVNHLSDSISIVDVATDPPRVVRTLLVGDEPHHDRAPRAEHCLPAGPLRCRGNGPGGRLGVRCHYARNLARGRSAHGSDAVR